MHLTPEEKAVGKGNFESAIGSELTRREFLQGSLAASLTATGVGFGAYYFGYDGVGGDPVRIGVIGTGDEGSVLIGAHNPEYVQVKAIADIRPYNIHRAFLGDQASETAYRVRPGLMNIYDWTTEDQARQNVKVYAEDYHDLLNDPDIEGVIIALPLHLHAPVAIEAMRAGKHVLTEKLMAHSIHEGKDMSRVAANTGLHLATGHQRHYSILYDNAIHTINSGLIGDIHHIRAQWHRNNLPGHDSWSQKLPQQLQEDLNRVNQRLAKDDGSVALLKQQELLTQMVADGEVDAEKYGYESKKLENGQQRTALEELIRWRLWNRTGGGLMAELGSHQLDAASLFISALHHAHDKDPSSEPKKVQPLSVTAVGGRHIFPADRDVDDHVYCMYEFPAPDFAEDPNKKIVVTYSSINGNGYGGYGETVMGTQGTLILDREKDVMLFKNSDTKSKLKVSKSKAGTPMLDTTESGGDQSVGNLAMNAGPISRGYREEIEHWAYCIRANDPEVQPRCRPEVALADAIIALTSNLAMRGPGRIDFKPEWFDIASDETPEGVAPSIQLES
jgi:predicted dehydrogenase